MKSAFVFVIVVAAVIGLLIWALRRKAKAVEAEEVARRERVQRLAAENTRRSTPTRTVAQSLERATEAPRVTPVVPHGAKRVTPITPRPAVRNRDRSLDDDDIVTYGYAGYVAPVDLTTYDYPRSSDSSSTSGWSGGGGGWGSDSSSSSSSSSSDSSSSSSSDSGGSSGGGE